MKLGDYPPGCTQAMHDEAMGQELTTEQANEIERRLEEKAEDEISAGADAYTEWLANDGLEHALSIAKAATYWPPLGPIKNIYTITEREAKRLDNVAEAIGRAKADYIAYRVNTFTDYERAEIEREVCGDES